MFIVLDGCFNLNVHQHTGLFDCGDLVLWQSLALCLVWGFVRVCSRLWEALETPYQTRYLGRFIGCNRFYVMNRHLGLFFQFT